MIAEIIEVNLQELTVDDILSCYSGLPGCCCGCRGNHRYNSKYVDEGTKKRGYQVTSDEVNDKQVKKVLKLLQQADPANVEFSADGNNFSIEVNEGTHLYIVYPRHRKMFKNEIPLVNKKA